MAMAQFDASNSGSSSAASSSSASASGPSRAEIQMLLSQFDSMINQLHDYPAKDIINSLTIMADRKIQFASEIASFLETKLYRVPPNYKLPIFYLLDSILKNVGGPYPALLGRNIVPSFLSCIKQVSHRDLQRFIHVLNTWESVRLFSGDALVQMRAASNRAQQSADPSVRHHPVSFATTQRPIGRPPVPAAAAPSPALSSPMSSSSSSSSSSLAGDMELRSLLTKLQNEMGIHPTQHMSLEEVRTNDPAYYKQLLEYQAQQQHQQSTTTTSLHPSGIDPSSCLPASASSAAPVAAVPTAVAAAAAAAAASVLGSAPVLPTPTASMGGGGRDPRDSRRRPRGDKMGTGPNKRRARNGAGAVAGAAAVLTSSSHPSMPPNQRVGPPPSGLGPGSMMLMEDGAGAGQPGQLDGSGPTGVTSAATAAAGTSKSANVAHLMQLLKRKKRNSPPKIFTANQQLEEQEVVNEPSGTFAASTSVSPSGPPPSSSLTSANKRAAPDAAAVMSILKKLKGINERNARGGSTGTTPGGLAAPNSTSSLVVAPPLEKLVIQKERNEANVQLLYAALPLVCSESGLRFKDEAKLHAHYDFLFQYRRAQKEQSKGGISRCWYPTVELWISDVSRESGVDSMSRTTVFDNKQQEEDAFEDKLDKSRVPVDEQVTTCRICGESFQKCWDEEEEEWVYKNAIVGQVHALDATVKHATIFHRYCYDTVLANSKYITEEHLIPIDDESEVDTASYSEEDFPAAMKQDPSTLCKDEDDEDDDDDKRVS